LIHCRERAKRSPAQSAQPVLVDGTESPLAGRGQLAAAGDAHRLEPAFQQRCLGSHPHREGDASELAEGAAVLGGAVQLLADRVGDRSLEGDARPPRVARPGLEVGPASGSRPEVRHHEDGVHLRGGAELVGQVNGPYLPEGGAIERGEHERLACGPALEDPGELEEGGGIRRAPRGVRGNRGVSLREHHQLPAGGARATTDHVHQIPARIREAVALDPKAAPLEPVRHLGGRGSVPGAARLADRVA
jgi:hypothetical protein